MHQPAFHCSLAGGICVDIVRAKLYCISVHVTERNTLLASEITYTLARANLAALLEQATSDREPVIIHRRGAEDVALIAASELSSLVETAHLLRSPRNAARLLAALERARRAELPGENVQALRQELGLDASE